MDKIRILNISLFGYHGCTAEEQRIGRPFEVDVEMEVDLRAAGAADDLAATVDYGAVCQLVSEINAAGPYHLLETFAERIAKEILSRYPVSSVTIRARKPNPPVGLVVSAAEIEITRKKV